MIINGKSYDYDNITISNLLTNLKLNEEKVVVEVNYEIISKDIFKSFLVKANDSIEVLSFVGGG